MTDAAINELERAAEQHAENLLEEESDNVEYSPPVPVKFEDDVETDIIGFLSGKSEKSDIVEVTRKAAQRLNFGLIVENIRVIMDLYNTRDKISKLEASIYTNVNGALKETIELYRFEKNHYLQQLEFVRKYVLNNKSALDDLNADTNELADLLTQVPLEKRNALIEFLKGLLAEPVAESADLLGDDI